MITENKKSVIVVARWRGYEEKKPEIAEFAYSGQETGMGRTIEHTTDISEAENYGSAYGIMTSMGGRYNGYEAVEVEVKYQEKGIQKFPDPKDVWDR